MRETNYSLEKAALAFIAGGLTGAVVALLLAPQSGTRTRRQIQRTREDLADRIEDFRLDLESNLDKLIDESMDRVEKGLHRATEIAEKVKQELVPTLEKGRELISRKTA